MNKLIHFGNNGAMYTAALTMRLLISMTMEYSKPENAAWLCPVIAFLLCLPLLFSLNKLTEQGTSSPWNKRLSVHLKRMISILFCLLLAYDAAVIIRIAASSYNVVALNNVTVHLLILPLVFFMIAVIFIGRHAINNSAAIAFRIALPVILILLIIQLKGYDTDYLFPVLGGGLKIILHGSVRCAGNIALLALMFTDKDCGNPIRTTFASVILSSVLLLAWRSGFPSMPGASFTQAARLEILLSNGRMSLAPQFLLLVLWYGGLLYLLAAETCTAAFWLNECGFRLQRWIPAVLLSCVIAAAAIVNGRLLSASQHMGMCYYPVIGMIVALFLLLTLIQERRQYNS